MPRTVLEEPFIARVGAKRLPTGFVRVWSTRSLRCSDPNFRRTVAAMGTVASNKLAETTELHRSCRTYFEESEWNHMTYSLFCSSSWSHATEKLATGSAPCY